MSQLQLHPEIEVTGVCDIWGERVVRARTWAPRARGFADHRRVLEIPDLDIVVIATPDHWHAAIAVDCLNAGKDVYVEKPLTFRMEEGPSIVKAARVNGRVCQVGMQQRSGPHYLRAKREYMDSHRLGKITYVRTWWHGNSYFLQTAPASIERQPADLDWGHFLGQVQWRDWNPRQYLNWRSYLDFGGGQVTDLFTHWVDVVHMFMDQDIPRSAVALGGIFHFKDGRTAPDTINVTLEYPGEYTVTFEGLLGTAQTNGAVEFFGTEGRLSINRERYEFYSNERGALPVVVQAHGPDITRNHVDNFLDCIRSRKRPNGDVMIGNRSVQAAHLAHRAYLERRRVEFDPVREQVLPAGG